MTGWRYWIIAILLCSIIISLGMIAARQNKIIRALEDGGILPLATTTTYIHGTFMASDTLFSLAGGTAKLYYGGQLLRSSTSVAGGAFGFEVTTRTGLYQVQFMAPPGMTVTGVQAMGGVTDFEFLSDGQSIQFRVSPAGGTAGDFHVLCANLQTPTATWIPTPTLTPIQPTRTATPSATPTFTPAPVTPSPTWTPGPTPTLCFIQATAEELDLIRAAMNAQYPLEDSELTRAAFKLGLGWPMISEETAALGGQVIRVRLFSPFYVVIQHEDGCYSIIDAAGLMP